MALPSELERPTQIKLVHDYVQTNFVDRGMCADWSIHDKEDGNPHAHIMLTTRAIKKKRYLGAEAEEHLSPRRERG
ncbi:MobA/MobL family protein [Lactiplantibacillus plantarum]|uniref:MobA/MobL family protein n=1 Tax=Lactiplantibacillus plantarum TaxID=1590 RepID=UPI0021CAF7F2|nr:MobA/MobL family protein [Lactiplantibacillus plantarum]